MKYWIALTLCLILLLKLQIGYTAEQSIQPVLITEKKEVINVELFQELNKLKQTELLRLEWARPINTEEFIYIIAGPEALIEYLHSKIRTPAIATLISSQSFNEIMKNYPNQNVTAIYSDPNPVFQLEVAKKLLPQPDARFAVWVDDTQKYTWLLNSAKEIDLNIELVHVIKNNLDKALGRLKDFDGLIALYDSGIYNKHTIKKIIRSTYRRRIVMVGYSRPMVKAGAAAAPYSTIGAIAYEIDAVIEHYKNHKKLPAPRYPHLYSTETNEVVTRSLDINVAL